mmetsp:Transcript_12276/g.27872  ORF Transcript_12276/g.27872 Transcript_12276/m.27872 type:complete len:225 (-) Transcript_12276:48-722(-)
MTLHRGAHRSSPRLPAATMPRWPVIGSLCHPCPYFVPVGHWMGLQHPILPMVASQTSTQISNCPLHSSPSDPTCLLTIHRHFSLCRLFVCLARPMTAHLWAAAKERKHRRSKDHLGPTACPCQMGRPSLQVEVLGVAAEASPAVAADPQTAKKASIAKRLPRTPMQHSGSQSPSKCPTPNYAATCQSPSSPQVRAMGVALEASWAARLAAVQPQLTHLTTKKLP